MAGIIYVALFLVIATPGYFLFGPKFPLPASAAIGTAVFLFVLWLFRSNPTLQATETRWGHQEEERRDEWQTHRYSVAVIKRRMKEISR
jgi:hypothetical protein